MRALQSLRPFALGVLAAGVMAACSDAGPDAPPARPNVVLVTVDTLRADHCSAYGYVRPTTPMLEALADQGTLFETAYAVMPTTAPSQATVFTSTYPDVHGVVKNGLVLDGEHHTLAEVLRRHGYQTGAFVSSFAVHRKFGLDQGFDVYDDDFSDAEGKPGLDMPVWEGESVDRFDRLGRFTTAEAAAWLAERDTARPFFLWVHYFEPHRPCRPVEPYRSDFLRAASQTRVDRLHDAYDGEVRAVDHELEVLLAAVDAQGSDFETLTIFTADHGEGLFEHGWMTHGVYVYDEQVRVPFVVRWPGRVPAGRRVTEPVALIDIFPTVASLLGVPTDGLPLQGRDLSAVWRGDAEADPEREVFLQRCWYEEQQVGPLRVIGKKYAVRRGPWKLIVATKERSVELYHLGRDPGELENVFAQNRAVADDLSRSLVRWRTRNAARAAPLRQVAPEDRERLRVLGYAD